MTTHDAIRNHLLAWACVHDPTTPAPSYEELCKTEWSDRFEREMRTLCSPSSEEFFQLMRNRLVVGGMRYSRFGDPRKGWPHRRNLPGLVSKIELWDQTGNAEFLVDIANYCMVLYEYDEPPMPTETRLTGLDKPTQIRTLLYAWGNLIVRKGCTDVRLGVLASLAEYLFVYPEHPKHHFRAIDRNDNYHTRQP